MSDIRQKQLADMVVQYSLKLKPGENVLFEAFDVPPALIAEMVRSAHAAGARPFVHWRSNAITRELLDMAGPEQLETWGKLDRHFMEHMQCYVGVRGADNSSEMADLSSEKMSMYAKLYGRPVHMEQRVNKTRWVVMRYPSPSMAQMANVSTAKFEDYFYRVCTLDYAKMSRAMDPLAELMVKTERVHIKGPGTDLKFSIKGIGSVKCDGQINIPDGECYTAPVKDSVEGTISYNTPSLYLGTTYENIRFTFQKGKLVKAESTESEKMNKVLDQDEGARYIGEFSLGFNPYITTPMKDTLFDEKIAGSLHFTPGNAYEWADNGNRSSVHWDIVLIQTPECGGGEVWFDDRLIRKDGRFVVPELEGLNPENLT